MLRIKVLGLAAAVAAAGWPVCASAQQSGLEADAIAFGTLGTAFQMDLSPDGTKVVFVGPGPGPYRVGYVADLANGSSRPVVTTSAATQSPFGFWATITPAPARQLSSPACSVPQLKNWNMGA